ncbi:MAG: hypothetical protein E7266_06570 [Lachnospiraceae bacterium]|nr:hypothetical protein [Lachnospiraceae bacterium]
MNIVFWSNSRKKCGTTSNLIAIAALSSMVYELKTIILNAGKNEELWRKNFITDINCHGESESIFKEDFSYYNCYGIDNIIDELKLREGLAGIIEDNMFRVKDTDMYYIPPSKRYETGLYLKEMENVLPEIMKSAEKLSDITFINVENGNGKLSKTIIEHADVVVVNISEDDMSDFDDEKLRNKAVFIIGRSSAPGDKIKGIAAGKYKKHMDNISVISDWKNWENSVEEGRIISFINEAVHSGNDEENFRFVKELFDAMNMILKKAGYDV